MIQQLAADPSSHTCAALNGWSHPIDYTTIVLADLFDLTAAVHTGKQSQKHQHQVRPWLERKRKGLGALVGALKAGTFR